MTDLPTQFTNLITEPDDWYPYETAPSSYSVNIHLDNSVEYIQGQASIRIDQHTNKDSNSAREADSRWIAVSPGEEIVFSCWIKTSTSSLGYNYATGYGARIGCDFYDDRYVTGISWNGAYTIQPTYQQVVNNFVNWNTGEWTLKTIDFVVPQTVYDSSGVGHTPTGIIPWLQVTLPNDQGSAWFADAALYIINS